MLDSEFYLEYSTFEQINRPMYKGGLSYYYYYYRIIPQCKS